VPVAKVHTLAQTGARAAALHGATPDCHAEALTSCHVRAHLFVYVICNLRPGGIPHTLSAARVPLTLAERWAKGGEVRPPELPSTSWAAVPATTPPGRLDW